MGGSATYQNEVTEFSIPGAGASAFPNTKKDQYKIGLELSQTLFDAGLTKAQMEIEELNTISRENSLKLFIALGFFILFGFVSFMFFQSPDSTMKSTFLPLLIRGVGLGMLITPIITLSIEGLKGADLNQGTGLTNMTRQLGGAVGIAVINLYISHRQSLHINDLSVDTNQGFEVVNQVFNNNTQLFLSNGFDQGSAQAMATGAMEGAIQQQALLLSYLDSFAFVGILCILTIPLAFLFKTPKGGIKKVTVME